MRLPLQSDNRFEKIRFLQTEELSNRVYEMMDKGKIFSNMKVLEENVDIPYNTKAVLIFSEDDLLLINILIVVDENVSDN